MNNVIKFAYYTKRESDVLMCTILKKIKGKTPEQLLKEYNIAMKPPINVAKLLEKLGISTIGMDFSGLEEAGEVEPGSILGAAFSKEDSLAIFYKKSDTFHRITFTIAHELGHCCLHSENFEIGHVQFRREKTYDETQEREANIFAGELLIPYESLIKEYEKFIIPSLATLSEIFDVSTNVMAARLDYLNLAYYKDSAISEAY